MTLTRAQAYEKLLTTSGLFQQDAAAILRAGKEFALSGRVELNKEPRGVCLSVKEWNDALMLVTLEGADGKIAAQVWVVTFGLPRSHVDQLKELWGARLKSVLA